MPITDQFTGREREAVKNIYLIYSEELEKENRTEIAREFVEISEKL